MAIEYDYPDTESTRERTEEFKLGVLDEKAKRLSKNSPFTVDFLQQVKACIIRQYQIIWTDKATFAIKQISTVIQALVAGSLFYNAPDNSGGLFIKSGALFFSLLYNSLLAMSEVTDSFSGRPVLIKHKYFAFPSGCILHCTDCCRYSGSSVPDQHVCGRCLLHGRPYHVSRGLFLLLDHHFCGYYGKSCLIALDLISTSYGIYLLLTDAPCRS